MSGVARGRASACRSTGGGVSGPPSSSSARQCMACISPTLAFRRINFRGSFRDSDKGREGEWSPRAVPLVPRRGGQSARHSVGASWGPAGRRGHQAGAGHVSSRLRGKTLHACISSEFSNNRKKRPGDRHRNLLVGGMCRSCSALKCSGHIS